MLFLWICTRVFSCRYMYICVSQRSVLYVSSSVFFLVLWNSESHCTYCWLIGKAGIHINSGNPPVFESCNPLAKDIYICFQLICGCRDLKIRFFLQCENFLNQYIAIGFPVQFIFVFFFSFSFLYYTYSFYITFCSLFISVYLHFFHCIAVPTF